MKLVWFRRTVTEAVTGMAGATGAEVEEDMSRDGSDAM
jgi:hypothetical protein